MADKVKTYKTTKKTNITFPSLGGAAAKKPISLPANSKLRIGKKLAEKMKRADSSSHIGPKEQTLFKISGARAQGPRRGPISQTLHGGSPSSSEGFTSVHSSRRKTGRR